MQNNIFTSQFGDPISKLPTDESIPTHNELEIINTIFNKKTTDFFSSVKDIIIVGILFFIFSIPITNSIIGKIMPNTSTYVLLGIKTLLFMVLYFLIQNIYLVRQN